MPTSPQDAHIARDRWVCAGTAEVGSNLNRTGWLDNRDVMLRLVMAAVQWPEFHADRMMREPDRLALGGYGGLEDEAPP